MKNTSILTCNKNSKSFGALWLGAMYMHNDKSFSGKIGVPEINPDLALLHSLEKKQHILE